MDGVDGHELGAGLPLPNFLGLRLRNPRGAEDEHTKEQCDRVRGAPVVLEACGKPGP